jgi:nitrogen regulatory protein PII
MKLITAIVRPEKLDELIGTLIDNRAHGLIVSEVRGFWSAARPASRRPD